ncbi:hypothetical protein TTHERM_00039090 (macronuclear) [Tetrahymena thermophila SB210]|uniref:Zinc carboxypeptidase family protein n=1 Tax=Tetrahymena thermophila (strain SB210) TaxID=312017 RepID=Q22M10_TETTS|nr:hypothetical protein TTHERM_00039090 [Tetrahymena thermophila SB210]EAR86661.2 hypothetical protein TTHERM_00039090 [Tetrahymena thermophila SB210]|eukprot:XP_977210.2 hypothetical protein TTHERM_00039090 [Tetrahymena thermophila SB210]
MEKFELKCPKHPQKKIKFLVNSIYNDQQVLICSKCIIDSEIRKGEFILISQIMQQGDDNLIQKWPPLEDSQIIKKLVDLTQENNNITLMNNVNGFFEDLKQKILEKIGTIQKIVMTKASDLSNQNEQIIQKYKEISQIHQLRQLLMNEKKQDYNNLEQKCKQLIKELELQKEKNQLIFQELYFNMSQVGKDIDFQSTNVIQEQILLLLDRFNFLQEKQNEEQEEIDKRANSQLLNNKPTIQYEKINNSDRIYKLISNESNYCSKQFLKDIKQILKSIEPLLSQIEAQDIYQKDKEPIKFKNLKKENMEKIESYAQHIYKINQKKKQYIKQIEQSKQIKEINKILNFRLNYLTDSFKNNFYEYLIETYPFLSSIDVDQITTSSENISSLQQLNDQETNELTLLIKKRLEFNQQNVSDSKYIVDQLYQQLSIYIPQNDIRNLFSRFPIFDLIKINRTIDILQKIYFYEDSNKNELLIKKHSNNQITIESNNQIQFSVLCLQNFTFEKNNRYIIRIKVEQQRYYSEIQFSVGLLYQSRYLKYFNYQNSLQTQQVPFSNGNQIEIRIHINESIFEVLDYPNYNTKIVMMNYQSKYQLQSQFNHKLFLNLYKNANISIMEAYIDKEQQ